MGRVVRQGAGRTHLRSVTHRSRGGVVETDLATAIGMDAQNRAERYYDLAEECRRLWRLYRYSRPLSLHFSGAPSHQHHPIAEQPPLSRKNPLQPIAAPQPIGTPQNIVHDLRQRGVTLKATEQPIDTSTAAGKCFLDMLGVFAEFETNLRKERQMEGIARAKASGIEAGKGRPVSIEVIRVREMRTQGLGPTAIAKALGIGRASVYRMLDAGGA
jgi:hypothetical protein